MCGKEEPSAAVKSYGGWRKLDHSVEWEVRNAVLSVLYTAVTWRREPGCGQDMFKGELLLYQKHWPEMEAEMSMQSGMNVE